MEVRFGGQAREEERGEEERGERRRQGEEERGEEERGDMMMRRKRDSSMLNQEGERSRGVKREEAGSLVYDENMRRRR